MLEGPVIHSHAFLDSHVEWCQDCRVILTGTSEKVILLFCVKQRGRLYYLVDVVICKAKHISCPKDIIVFSGIKRYFLRVLERIILLHTSHPDNRPTGKVLKEEKTISLKFLQVLKFRPYNKLSASTYQYYSQDRNHHTYL